MKKLIIIFCLITSIVNAQEFSVSIYASVPNVDNEIKLSYELENNIEVSMQASHYNYMLQCGYVFEIDKKYIIVPSLGCGYIKSENKVFTFEFNNEFKRYIVKEKVALVVKSNIINRRDITNDNFKFNLYCGILIKI